MKILEAQHIEIYKAKALQEKEEAQNPQNEMNFENKWIEGQNIWTNLHLDESKWTFNDVKFDNSGIRLPFFKFFGIAYAETNFPLKRPCVVEGEFNAIKTDMTAKNCTMSLFNNARKDGYPVETMGYSMAIVPDDSKRKVVCYGDGQVLVERVYEAKNYSKDKIHFKIEATDIDTKFYFEGVVMFTIPGTLEGHAFNNGRLMFIGKNRFISNVLVRQDDSV